MKQILHFDIENGISVGNLLCRGLTGYVTEAAQHGRLTSLWLLLQNGEVLRIQSTVTTVGPWNEVGTLVFRCLGKIDVQQKWITLPPAWSEKLSIERLVLEDDDFCAESGFVLKNRTGEEFIIVTGAFPHTVEIFAPFFPGDFQPEYEIDKYRREVI